MFSASGTSRVKLGLLLKVIRLCQVGWGTGLVVDGLSIGFLSLSKTFFLILTSGTILGNGIVFFGSFVGFPITFFGLLGMQGTSERFGYASILTVSYSS